MNGIEHFLNRSVLAPAPQLAGIQVPGESQMDNGPRLSFPDVPQSLFPQRVKTIDGSLIR